MWAAPAIALATAAPAAAVSGQPTLSFARGSSTYRFGSSPDDRVEFQDASINVSGGSLNAYDLTISLRSDGPASSHLKEPAFGPGPDWDYFDVGPTAEHLWAYRTFAGDGTTIVLGHGFWTYQRAWEGRDFTVRVDAPGFRGAVDVFTTVIRPPAGP